MDTVAGRQCLSSASCRGAASVASGRRWPYSSQGGPAACRSRSARSRSSRSPPTVWPPLAWATSHQHASRAASTLPRTPPTRGDGRPPGRREGPRARRGGGRARGRRRPGGLGRRCEKPGRHNLFPRTFLRDCLWLALQVIKVEQKGDSRCRFCGPLPVFLNLHLPGFTVFPELIWVVVSGSRNAYATLPGVDKEHADQASSHSHARTQPPSHHFTSSCPGTSLCRGPHAVPQPSFGIRGHVSELVR